MVPLCLCGADNQASGEMVLPTLLPRTEEEIDKGLGFQQSFFHIPGPRLVGRGTPVLGPGCSGRSGWCSVSVPSPPPSLLLVLRLRPNPGREGAVATEDACSHSAHPFRGKWSCPLSFCLHAEVGAVFLRDGPLYSPCFVFKDLGSSMGALPQPS